MEKTPNPDSGEKQTKGFKLFAAQRIVIGAIAIVLLLWLVHYGLSFFDTPQTAKPGHTPHIADAAGTPSCRRGRRAQRRRRRPFEKLNRR